MGIVNLSPDSFTGDGLPDAEAALARARQLVEDGADIVDVGGESTRPGAVPVDAETELRRLMPAVRLLVRELGVPVSIDTYKAAVAYEALEAGVAMVNDVWGFRADPDLTGVVAQSGVPVVLMHNQRDARYRNLVSEVMASLRGSIEIALAAGVKPSNIVVDPGIGFGKTQEQNLEMLGRLDELKALGQPILLGTSRKFGIGRSLNLPPEQRLQFTATTLALGIAKGADIVRVHDVREMARVVRFADAIVRRIWRPST
ncbi:MAG: dihydropteroate synthase [Chloroflexi bacterium]|nr:dihydropteroate synthase [Chloroflexota bacterium]